MPTKQRKFFDKFNEDIKKSIQYKKTTKNIENSYSDKKIYSEPVEFPVYEDFRDQIIAETVYVNTKNHYISRIASSRPLSEVIKAYVNSRKLEAQLSGEDVNEEEKAAAEASLSAIRNAYKDSKLSDDEKRVATDILNGNQSFEEKVNAISSLEGDAYKEVNIRCGTKALSGHYTILENDAIYNGFMSIIDELEMSDDELSGYEPIENIYSADVPYMSEKIEELKNSTQDKEYIESLDKANSFLVRGDSKIVGMHSNAAEKYAKLCELERRNKEGEFLTNNLPDIASHLKVSSSRHFMVDEKTCKEKGAADYKEQIAKLVESKESLIPESEQKWILEYTDKLYNRGILTNEPSSSEQGVKIYAFKSLVESKMKLEEAVTNGAQKDIIKATKDYETMYSNYKASIKELKEHVGHSYCSENITVARTSDVPYEFRDDVVGNSLLDNIEIMNGYCMNNGINVKDFIKNPFIYVRQQLEGYMYSKTDIADLINNHNDVAEYLINLESSNKGYEASLFADCERVLNGTVYMIQDPNERAKYQTTVKMFYASTIDSFMKLNTTPLAGKAEDKKEFVLNLITQEPTESKETFNPFLSPQMKNEINPATGKKIEVFNREEYLEKNNNVLSAFVRSIETVDKLEQNPELQELASDSMQKLSTMALDKYKDKYPIVEKVVNQVQSNRVPNAQSLKTIKLLGAFEYASKKGISKENSMDVMKSLAKMRKDYKSNSWISRIFNGNLRAQSKVLKAMTNEVISATGKSAKDIERVCKALTKNISDARKDKLVGKLFAHAPETAEAPKMENSDNFRHTLSVEEQKNIDDLVEGKTEKTVQIEETIVTDQKEIVPEDTM